jgi:hypothetical protein
MWLPEKRKQIIKSQSFSEILISAVLICIVGFIYNYEVSIGLKIVGWDTLDAYFPYFLTIVDGVRSGTFPIVDPYYQSGVYIPVMHRTWLYTLYVYPFIFFSQFLNPLVVFGNMMLFYGILGGIGFYVYSIRVTKYRQLSVLVSVIYMLGCIFIFLGQLSFFLSAVMIPWFLLLAHLYLDTKKISIKIFFCLLLIGTFAVGVSPWDLLIIFIFVGVYLLINTPFYVSGIKDILIFLMTPALVWLIYQHQGINVLYESYQFIQSDYKSPEPRLRSIGVQTPQLLIDNIYRALLGLFDVRLGAGGQWTYGVTFAPLIILVFGVINLRPISHRGILILLSLMAVFFLAYTSPNQLEIYKIIQSIPVFNANRWFGYGLFFAQVFLLLLIVNVYAHTSKVQGLKKTFKARFLVAILLIYALSYYSSLNIHGVINDDEKLIPAIGARNVTHYVLDNQRRQANLAEYVFSDRSPMVDKLPISHGYSIVGDPLYWYFKDTWIAKSVFHVSDRVQLRDANFSCRADANLCVRHYANSIIESSPLNTLHGYINRADKNNDSNQLELMTKLISYVYSSNKLYVEVATNKPSFFFFNSPNFPGWEAKVNGVKTDIIKANGIFMAVRIDNSGLNKIEFVYVDSVFQYILPAANLLLLFFILSQLGSFFWSRFQLRSATRFKDS